MSLLLEREPLLDGLTGYLDEALGGRGRLVFLGGEAGAGKTALVTTFTERAGDRVRVLRGACDGGTTPRPLGPLADIAGALGAAVVEQLDQDRPSRGPLFAAVRTALADRPTLLVVEDVHWADEATLDLVRFLGGGWAAPRCCWWSRSGTTRSAPATRSPWCSATLPPPPSSRGCRCRC